jgi:hypothetical protein
MMIDDTGSQAFPTSTVGILLKRAIFSARLAMSPTKLAESGKSSATVPLGTNKFSVASLVAQHLFTVNRSTTLLLGHLDHLDQFLTVFFWK